MTAAARGHAVAGLAFACALLLAACGQSGSGGSTGSSATPSSAAASAEASMSPVSGPPSFPASAAPSVVPSSPAASLASPVTGVVIAVDSAGLAKVAGFTLRLPDGSQQAFRIGVLENGDQFPPGHLTEHLASASPVRVYFRPDGADLVVYRIEDAG